MTVNLKYFQSKKYHAVLLLTAYLLILGFTSFHHHPVALINIHAVEAGNSDNLTSGNWHCYVLHIAANSFHSDLIDTFTVEKSIGVFVHSLGTSSRIFSTENCNYCLRGPPALA